jgi:hypothetical protein
LCCNRSDFRNGEGVGKGKGGKMAAFLVIIFTNSGRKKGPCLTGNALTRRSPQNPSARIRRPWQASFPGFPLTHHHVPVSL